MTLPSPRRQAWVSSMPCAALAIAAQTVSQKRARRMSGSCRVLASWLRVAYALCASLCLFETAGVAVHVWLIEELVGLLDLEASN